MFAIAARSVWRLFKKPRPSKKARQMSSLRRRNVENSNSEGNRQKAAEQSRAFSSGVLGQATGFERGISGQDESLFSAPAIEEPEIKRENTEDTGLPPENGVEVEPRTLETVLEETESQLGQEDYREEEVPPSLRLCAICNDEQASAQFPEVPEMCASSHESEACVYDWEVYLAGQIATQRPSRITCIQCPNTLTQADARRLATEETYQRFLEAELKEILSADGTFTWCISPNCQSGQQHFDGDIFTCIQCGHKHCTSCHLDWHAGETCEGTKERKLREEREALEAEAAEHERTRLAEERAAYLQRMHTEETASNIFMIGHTKICPGRDCNRRIAKVGGCDHMTCKCHRVLSCQSQN